RSGLSVRRRVWRLPEAGIWKRFSRLLRPADGIPTTADTRGGRRRGGDRKSARERQGGRVVSRGTARADGRDGKRGSGTAPAGTDEGEGGGLQRPAPRRRRR